MSWVSVVSPFHLSIHSPGDTYPLLTGGWVESPFISEALWRLSSVKLYGLQCNVPPLPLAVNGHTTFITADDHIVSCGGSTGQYTHRCLTLASSGWEAGPVGDLTQERFGAAVVTTLQGTYVLGGEGDVVGVTSDFLPRHSATFEAGPELPYKLYNGCAAGLSAQAFVVLGGFYSLTSVRQYDATHGWSEDWPELTTGRYAHGCAAYGRVNNTDYQFQKIIVAGGSIYDIGKSSLASMEILDITSKTLVAGPEMVTARSYFHLVLVERAGVEALLALGGETGSSTYLNTVEEYLVEQGEWVEREGMGEGMREMRGHYGASAVAASLIPCKILT